MSVVFVLIFKVEYKGEGGWEGGNCKRKFWIFEFLRDSEIVKVMWMI